MTYSKGDRVLNLTGLYEIDSRAEVRQCVVRGGQWVHLDWKPGTVVGRTGYANSTPMSVEVRLDDRNVICVRPHNVGPMHDLVRPLSPEREAANKRLAGAHMRIARAAALLADADAATIARIAREIEVIADRLEGAK